MIIIVIVLESMSGSPPGSYGQLIPSHLNPVIVHDGMHSSVPPVLPPHLLHVILNKEVVDHNDPSLLPEPDHVSLNHLYALSIKVCNSTREANEFCFSQRTNGQKSVNHAICSMLPAVGGIFFDYVLELRWICCVI